MALRALPTMMLRAAAAPARTSSRTIAPARQMQGLAGAALRSAVRVERAAAGPMTRLQTRASSTYSSSPKGTFPSLEYRLFLQHGGNTLSAWHDVPLYAGDGLLNFVCEIPKETKAKMEIATDEANTPIKQDVKKGKLRDYPYNIHWNYGCLPQTWEDPAHENKELGVKGDNDPVDVVEIGSVALASGSVTPVKPLGVFAMIDDGELDWKVIAIRADDPKAKDVNDVADVEKHFPGELEKIRVWFQDYKKPDGKPENKFGYNNKCMDKKFTVGVIEETHKFWLSLKNGSRKNDEELSLH